METLFDKSLLLFEPQSELPSGILIKKTDDDKFELLYDYQIIAKSEIPERILLLFLVASKVFHFKHVKTTKKLSGLLNL